MALRLSMPDDRRCVIDHDHQHGDTTYCFVHGGCRCDPCRITHAIYLRNARRLQGVDTLMPAHGATRRLRALARIGYSSQMLAPHFGLTDSRIARIRAGKQPEVRQSTHARIVTVYNRLSMLPQPAQGPVLRTINHARRQGWLAPLEWDEGELDAA